MPTMNAAQVRALSVEDMVQWPTLQLEQDRNERYNEYAVRRSCELFTRPEVVCWYNIEMMREAGDGFSSANVIMWLMAVRELEGRAGQEARLDISDDGIDVNFKFSRPTTEAERATARAWLDANPPQPVKWRPPARFMGRLNPDAVPNYVNPYDGFDEVVPDAPPPADEAGI